MTQDLAPHLTPGRAALGVLGVLLIYYWMQKFLISRRIAALGSRAPMIRTCLPFAVDFVYGYIQTTQTGQDLDFWDTAMRTARGASRFKTSPATVELNSGLSRNLFTADPENIKAIISSQFADYGKGKRFYEDWKELLGNSVFSTDGQLWAHSRQRLRPMFTKERITNLEKFETYAQKLITLLHGSDLPNRVVDIVPLFFRYTLDTATHYLLGKAANSLEDPGTRIVEAIAYIMARQEEFFKMDDFARLLSRTKFRQELKVIDNFLQPYIDEVLSRSAEELDPAYSKTDTFLDALAGSTRDGRDIRDQLLGILIAGRDTTAVTLSFALFELSRNPDILAKVRSEIAAKFGVGPNSRKPTYNGLKDMKCLQAVLNETMRLYAVVPLNYRHALQDTTLPRGGGPDGLSPIGVLGDTRIIFSIGLMMQREEVYPPPGSDNYFDPKTWLPQRWWSGWQPKPWEFLPFHRGQRTCIGQEFAFVEMQYTIIRILQVYKEIVAFPACGKEKVEDPTVRFEVTLRPACEFNCLFLKEGEENKILAFDSLAG
ncbi:hypothetical protein N7499_003489 [Penicillium canescens]|uniref:Cytochrome P450 alkane hydroxylase n=1 Tax=Penicillium canescens TaxID=5083 RepID=A0AAD6N7C8_PENCN|nr:uncharacterized protein N7446_012412 [Penicillium canescens]KAJ6020192.1 hypothetical protein N7522_000267 [Penicillium canescens]KAJ6038149.1 hypothetical protein N7460_007920 [Penicillium canescens]KAJ6045548.1 hypothetical protein N7446_012412 [Penicillium canescens]KAJ6061230.1 hypothetical protein N7444_001926 [Penicillium canescens]KAJ6090775.1 hypothetical protein N7499_003489 [Penicillium canescens]